MWPDVVGPEWQWHLLATIGSLAVVFAALWLADRAAKAISHEDFPFPDRLLILWHRYEVGDLTSREFEREKRALARRQRVPGLLWTRPLAMDPATRRALNGSARAFKRGAAAAARPVHAGTHAASSAERTSPGSA